ncbi:phage major tail tube protein [Vibrio coralliilyticus]|uniref:Phage major tail tube protein n=1 Tax=Vibrio coralliilyticus TaxID=190893 RepID=A0AAN0SHV9_9VIBR|nr:MULTISPECIES: phage major tail tube protein [Vibrio]AIW21358.1 phage major tail tube protein [Vibrio coralliilyticus]MDA0118541.1 phage major tail tube protein [Vibrio sp. T11.5]NOH41722.1 phage major tail tube protein [Vibrio coralliilyticus]
MSNWVRKKYGLYIAGRDKVGAIVDHTPPVLEVITEDFVSGGMDMPIPMDMGMNPISTSWTMGEDTDTLRLFGLIPGKKVTVFVRGLLMDDESGDTKEVIEEYRGILTKIDRGTYSPNSSAPYTYEMKLSYYRYEVNGEDIHEIDPKNMIRKIDGVDQLAAARKALGK